MATQIRFNGRSYPAFGADKTALTPYEYQDVRVTITFDRTGDDAADEAAMTDELGDRVEIAIEQTIEALGNLLAEINPRLGVSAQS